jgi:hypothetical protein
MDDRVVKSSRKGARRKEVDGKNCEIDVLDFVRFSSVQQRTEAGFTFTLTIALDSSELTNDSMSSLVIRAVVGRFEHAIDWHKCRLM